MNQATNATAAPIPIKQPEAMPAVVALPLLVDRRTAAAMLGVCLSTLEHWLPDLTTAPRRPIRTIHLGRRHLVDRASLEKRLDWCLRETRDFLTGQPVAVATTKPATS